MRSRHNELVSPSAKLLRQHVGTHTDYGDDER